MFCFQCQEAANGNGCTTSGVCGKTEDTAALQDALIHIASGVSIYANALNQQEDTRSLVSNECYGWIRMALFTTITNANFDNNIIESRIWHGIGWRLTLRNICVDKDIAVEMESCHAASWNPTSKFELSSNNRAMGVLRTSDPDSRSLRELLTYGLKGMAAYLHHAAELGQEDKDINAFLVKALVATINPLINTDLLTALVLEAGEKGVAAMKLLDQANTSRFGQPEITDVQIGVGQRPGILVSGHDLNDLEALLEQTKTSGIDIYTHCEMLPGHCYPKLKEYKHLYGNYGNAWWQQDKEFTSFNGPILFTTNCIVPPPKNASYKNKVFTTGACGHHEYQHIATKANGNKDFSEIIKIAQTCQPPIEIETGNITAGFAHHQIDELEGSILKAINQGDVKKFVVMAGCDGRHNKRKYYTEFAEQIDNNTVILTAGCAKYRYNKLDLGSIDSRNNIKIPRVLDAGQCNDSYSLALTAIKLKKALGIDDINKLPIEYNIAWYEQKAVIVLLALLYLGIKNIQLGPTLPAFLSPGVANILVEQFGIHGIAEREVIAAKV